MTELLLAVLVLFAFIGFVTVVRWVVSTYRLGGRVLNDGND